MAESVSTAHVYDVTRELAVLLNLEEQERKSPNDTSAFKYCDRGFQEYLFIVTVRVYHKRDRCPLNLEEKQRLEQRTRIADRQTKLLGVACENSESL